MFRSVVWPAISIHEYKLLQMENEEGNVLAKELDMRAGIDAWVVKNNGIIGMSCRIQWIEKDKMDPFNTFTIRVKRDTGAESELDKRYSAMKEGLIIPQITCQAYLDLKTNELLSVGITKTAHIFKCLEMGLFQVRFTSNAKFVFVYWETMIENGFPVVNKISDMYPNMVYNKLSLEKKIICEPPIDIDSLFD